ncbi:GntR family transcriptional regulator [Alcaligenes pakistanensis]|uniref:GntR family transcriptional regulator n=1 Tax=Alcaligenes pakistanensis TaxID=1482717 RepID=A0A8H9IFA2_9BURK|nr:PLP-dependent aminotransferase family protein [Alcaligenes pakistanensis]GHC38633.1 GntR family transcriptional regulator [Alcaligenes pakistanensis]
MPRTAHNPKIPSLGELDRRAGALGRQLAQKLRDAVKSGALKSGESLPSTRALASSLGVARGTVVEAFEQLIAEGFLESSPGVGTYIAHTLTSPKRQAKKRIDLPLPAQPAPPSAEPFNTVAAQFEPLPPVPFAVSIPLGAASPGPVWRRLGNRLRAHGLGAPGGYGDPQGALPLREAIAEYVRRSRSVRCEAEQVIVTTGTQQGLFLACLVLLGQEDFAWVENPAYPGITAILNTVGAPERMVRVPVDEEGLDVEAGKRLQADARVAFVTPSHQYPLGMPMSMARRNALLAWARAKSAWIVEDDYDSEFRYSGHPFPSMQGLDPERVIYLGTFSKVLFPSLRLGYAIVPPQLVKAFCGARVLLDRHPPSADQHVLASFISVGHLERHIRRMRGVYTHCRSHLFEIVREVLPGNIASLQPGDQGMHSVLWLAPSIDDVAVAQRALKEGVAVRPVSSMYQAGDGPPGLILGLSAFSREQMTEAASKLARIISELAEPSKSNQF